MPKYNSEKPEFKIVTMDERLQVDPRGRIPLTALSNGRFLAKATYGEPAIVGVPIDPESMADELLDSVRNAAIEPRELGEEI